jgi:Tfp pilus assembly protein PilX
MEKFWAAILIFVVVAAAGLMYVNQVYNPQKDSQAAMAETANRTLTAVKSEMENDSTPTVVEADDVINAVEAMCKVGNTVTITVNTGVETKNYSISDSGIVTQIGSITKHFLRIPERNAAGVLIKITFNIIG